jgi:hypothetical protein
MLSRLNEIIFKHPFTCMIAGPSKSGKTTLLTKILVNNVRLIDKPPDNIYYSYSRWQNNFNELLKLLPNIKFVEGLPDIDEFNANQNNLLILDDLMSECGKNDDIKKLFTIDSNHKNLSVFFLTQNMFSNDKNNRTISLNTNYMIIFNNPRDQSQFFYLARQMFPNNPKFLEECYHDAVSSQPYGYLFLDFTQTGFELEFFVCSIHMKSNLI